MAGEKQIYLYNIENKEEKIFYSLKEASNFLKVKNYVLSKHILNKPHILFKNKYVIKYTGIYSARENYFYNIGDIIDDEKGKIKIIEKKYKNNKLYYKYECLNCGYIGDIEQNRLIKRKQRCSCCCKNSKIINEKNCINATHPWIKEFLKNENDGKKYLHGSDKKIIFRCPNCKEEKLSPINKVIKNGFNCSNCGNGVSYPNKLMKEILKELKVDFIAEKKFIWSNNKRYDFFIPSKKIIIEMDGEQHYKFKEIKENDNLKDEMAYKNGILNVIRINCYKSDYKYIENELIKNNFFSFFNN